MYTADNRGEMNREAAIRMLADALAPKPQQSRYTGYSANFHRSNQFVGDNIALGNSVAIERVLTAQLATINEKTVRGFPAYDGEVIPFGEPIGEDFQEIADKFMEKQGDAIFIGPQTTELPTVNASIGEDVYPVRIIANKYGLSYIDLARSARALAQTGRAPETLLADAAMMVIAGKLDDYLMFGDEAANIAGFLNFPGVTTDPASAYDPYNAATTWQAHVDFIANLVGRLHRRNRLNTQNIQILVPDTMLQVWTNTYQENDSARTVLEAGLQANAARGLVGIRALNHLERSGLDGGLPDNVGTAGRDRVVTYVQDVRYVHAHTTPVGTMPRVQTDTGFNIPVFQPMSPCIVSDLTKMDYVDVVTAP